jgi:glycosyltransferase involved in cell wall biosynthesis
MLRRSIQCFLNQTYRDRELVVVYQSDDEATRQFLAQLRETSIHPVEVPAAPRLSLGSLRNIARQAGTGTYVAQWDDDDWCSPARLAEQMAAIRETGKRGCVLTRWTLYDYLTKRAYVSGERRWEATIVVERAILPSYPDVAKREDTPVVDELNRQGQLTLLDRPELYIYTYHGKNTWDRHHWEQILSVSRPLGRKTSRQMTALLGIEKHGAARFQTFTSNAILDSIAALSEKTPVTESKESLLSSCVCQTRGSPGEPKMAKPHRRLECLPAWEWNG